MRINCGSLVLVGGLLFGACDGDGSSSGSKFSTGLDASKTPATLSTAERTALCNKVAAFVPSMMTKADMCKISGVMGAMLGSMGGGDMKALCTTAYDACMKEPDEPTDTTDTASCTQGMSTCTATMGEIEACMNDMSTMMKTEMAKIPSCSQVNSSNLTSLTTSTATSTSPASCTALETKCPDMGTDSAVSLPSLRRSLSSLRR